MHGEEAQLFLTLRELILTSCFFEAKNVVECFQENDTVRNLAETEKENENYL